MPRALKLHEIRIIKKTKGAYTRWDGKDFYLGRWDHDRDEPSADAVERFDALRKLWSVDPDAPAPPPLDANPLLIVAWADWKDSPQGPRTRPEDVRRVELALFGTAEDPGLWSERRVAEFTPKAFLEWQTKLCDRDLSRWTVGQCRRLILRFFDWASIVGKATDLHPAALARVKPPAKGEVREATSRKPASEEDFEALTEVLRPGAKLALQLLWLTGGRPSEVLSLKCGEIIQSGSFRTAKGVRFELPEGVWAAPRSEHKTAAKGFDRVIFFGPQSQAALLPVLKKRKATDWLVRTRLKTPYTARTLADVVTTACERLEWPTLTPYQFRHGAAVRAQQEFSEAETGCWLGHKSRSVTGRYSGSDLKTAARVAAKMG